MFKLKRKDDKLEISSLCEIYYDRFIYERINEEFTKAVDKEIVRLMTTNPEIKEVIVKKAAEKQRK